MVPGSPDRDIAPGTLDLASASDADLARRIAAAGQDRAAEAELCRRFAPRIRLYGLKHLRDEDGARDLAQSVLLAVLESVRLGRLDDPERVDRFVLGTCRNLALEARRARARVSPAALAELDLVAVWPETDLVDVGAMHRCLARLDARARAVLHLSFGREKSAEDIARVLDTTAGNVRVVRHRAVAQLRSCFDGEGENRS